jgi:hypothetical protein
VWWWIKLGWRLRRLRPEVEKLASMKFGVNAAIQTLALIAQAALQASDILPGRGRFYASLVVTVAQAGVAVLSHFSNPDGSSVRLPYEPEKR